MARAFAAAHELGELEAVHLRHLHVDERERHVVLQQQLQRFGARMRAEQLHAVAAQQRRQREQVFFQVVDDQAFHRFVGSVGRRHDGPVHAQTPHGSASNRLMMSSKVSTWSAVTRASAASGICGMRALAGC